MLLLAVYWGVYTRQMIIVVGKPELYCGMMWRGMAKREGGIYACPYALCVHKSCPECGACVRVVLYVEKCLCEVTGEKN